MRYLYKEKGETPLECIERHQLHRPYTYAGRLDPMAEGVLLVLEGEECKDRERYLSKDKTYEYECIVGIKTDTSDALGCITDTLVVSTPPPHTAVTQIKGTVTLPYPIYSSKPVDGVPLFQYARNNKKVTLPTFTKKIFSHTYTGSYTMKGREVADNAIHIINKVKGDFRQKEIIQGWKEWKQKYSNDTFTIFSFTLHCESGVYVRSIVEKAGDVWGIPASVHHIKRTKVGDKLI